MNEQGPLDNPQDLWRSQTVEETDMNLEDIRRKALQFQRKVGRRNVREYISVVIAACLCAAGLALLPTTLLKAGAVLMLLGAIANAYQLHRDGAAHDVPVDVSATECQEFHRRELQRQKALLDRIGPAHIGPTLPGLAVFIVGAWLWKPSAVMAVATALSIGVMALVYWINVREARRLGREIEALGRN